MANPNELFRTGANTPVPHVNPVQPNPIRPAYASSNATPDSVYEQDVLQWIVLAVREGEALIHLESEMEDVDDNIRIALGDNRGIGKNPSVLENSPFFRNSYTMSRIGKNINDLASSITDFRPNGHFKTYNTLYEEQGIILDKLTTSWWFNMDIDIKLQLLVKQSLVGRTAYAQVVFNPAIHNGLGDLDIIVRDYRDVLPIRPNSKWTIQDSVGVVIRSKNTVNWGRSRYPDKASKIQPNNEGGLSVSWAQRGQVSSPTLDYLDRSNPKKKTDFAIPTYDHYEIYIKDGSINKSTDRVWIGPGPEGDNPWGYWVKAGEKLYPRLRLIVVANLNTVLYDGGSPYWHGMFPVIKLTLDPWPMTFLGKSAIADAKSPHKLYQELLQGVVDNCRKALKPGVIVDRQAVNRQVLEKFDTSEPGFKLRTNPSAGQGIIVVPPPILPPFIENRMDKAEQHVDHVMGILDMRALAQLKTANVDTDVETLLENLGPSVRTKGRMLEAFLRELGMMMKANFFQFYTIQRRIEILGADGMSFEDFDFDPGTLIPAFAATAYGQNFQNQDVAGKEFSRFNNEDNTPKTRAERAQEHIKSFTYYITPNSLLSLAKTQDKLLYLQLFRMGIL